MRKLLSILLLILPVTAIAQFRITGKVLDSAGKKPIPGATIFLSNTTMGAAARNDGSFVISNVKGGQYELTVSVVGYGVFQEKILVTRDADLQNITLKQLNVSLNEVKIKVDKNLPHYYNIFKSIFLGTGSYARNCKILNRQVLDLYHNPDTHSIHASSYKFLEIENRELGYKLKYLLSDFVLDSTTMTFSYKGSVVFIQMNGSASQMRKWKKNRLDIYEGSMMHFFRSCAANELKTAGFEVVHFTRSVGTDRLKDSINLAGVNAKIEDYKKLLTRTRRKNLVDTINRLVDSVKALHIADQLDKRPLSAHDFIFRTEYKNIYDMEFKDYVLVLYTKKRDAATAELYLPSDMPDYQSSVMHLISKNALFDTNGVLLEPETVLVEGFLAGNRIAKTLPFDYEPEK